MFRLARAPRSYQALGGLAIIGILLLPTPMTSGLLNVIPTEVQISLGAPLQTTTLSLGGVLGTHLNSPFYSVVVGDGGLNPNQLKSLGLFLNSTPIGFLRLGAGGPSFDPTTGTLYSAPPTGGAYVGASAPAVNFGWFQSWCYSRPVHCAWIVDLPAEENDSSAALHYAKWYHSVLQFVPTMWEFGNEPSAWTHFGKNMSKWSTLDNLVPTALDYATMAKNYANAIRAVYPNDKFVGIEASCACDHTWVTQTATTLGLKASAYAYHDYPSAVASTTNLSQFYGALQGPANIPNATSKFLSAITAGCSNCANVPLELGEYQGGPASGIAAYTNQYPGAAFLAASIIQALYANVSTLTVFAINWLYNSLATTLQPEGYLFQRILANMTMGTDYAVNVHAGGIGGVFALEVRNGTRDALFIVNTNMTFALGLTIGAGLFPIAKTGSQYSWSPTSAYPSFHRSFLLPSTYVLARQGILLLTNY